MTVSADTPACLHYAALVLPFQGAPRIALALNSCKSYFFCIQTQLAVQVLRIWFLFVESAQQVPWSALVPVHACCVSINNTEVPVESGRIGGAKCAAA